jgi:hypothetical protein
MPKLRQALYVSGYIMRVSFYICLFSLLIVLVFFSIYLQRRQLRRKIFFDIGLEEYKLKRSRRTIIVLCVTFLVSIVIAFLYDIFWLFVCFFIPVELVLNKRKPTLYFIKGDQLFYNGFWLKKFDLKDLRKIKFLPFQDSFKLVFINKSIVIPRTLFKDDQLVIFMNKLLQLSPDDLKIDEDAKSKLINKYIR